MNAASLATCLKRAQKVTHWFASQGVKDCVFGQEILNQLKVTNALPVKNYITTHLNWKPTKAHANPSDKVHGGAIATLIEYSGAIATLINDPMGRAPLCINSVIDYNAPCEINCQIAIEAKVNSITKGIAFTEVLLRDHGTNKLLAKGSQVMTLGEHKLGIDFTEEEIINNTKKDN
jgi:acyl-coenzyme A thioesterase PaaI-like protein